MHVYSMFIHIYVFCDKHHIVNTCFPHIFCPKYLVPPTSGFPKTQVLRKLWGLSLFYFITVFFTETNYTFDQKAIKSSKSLGFSTTIIDIHRTTIWTVFKHKGDLQINQVERPTTLNWGLRTQVPIEFR